MNLERGTRHRVLLFLLLLIGVGPCAAVARNIDPNGAGASFAWSENVGWINLAPAGSDGVTVTASAVTGFAWGENVGWINLSPATGGVRNDGAGRLSGFAWGENVGWINFAPSQGGGVTIDGAGQFRGFAWGENIGWINFAPSQGGVTTSWRAAVTDTTAPVVTPPADVTVVETEAGGARGRASSALAAFLVGGSATDTIDASPSRLSPQAGSTPLDNDTLFPLGVTTVNFRFQDDSGNVGSATSRVTVRAPLAVLALAKTAAPEPVSSGEALTYTVTVTNTGPDAASNVVIADTLPASVSYIVAGVGASACSRTGLVVTCEIGSLAAGASATATIIVIPTAAGTLSNTATATATEAEVRSATATTTVRATADLDIAVTAGFQGTLVAGRVLVYDFAVTSTGPDPATGVTITATLPENVTIVPGSGANCDLGAADARCTLAGRTITYRDPDALVPAGGGTLPSGFTSFVGFSIHVLPTRAGPLTVTASVAAGVPDPNLTNDAATAVVTVQDSADLVVSLVGSPASLLMGSPVTYTATVTNNGPETAGGVRLTTVLSSTMPLGSVTTTQGTCASTVGAGQELPCDLGSLAPGATATVTIGVTTTTPATHAITASATATQVDVDAANNTATVSTEVRPAIIVNSFAQRSGSTGTVCTLGAAIHAANLRTPVDGCAAGSAGGSTIILPAGTYTLTAVDNDEPIWGSATALPMIRGAITIQGAGAETTIIERAAGAPSFRLFWIAWSASGGRLTLNDVTLRGGRPSAPGGGGVFNDQMALAVNRSVLSDHDGAAIASSSYGATLTVTDSTFSGNVGGLGGAIAHTGSLSVTGSRFIANSTRANGLGGAIILSGGGTVADSVFTGNTAAVGGGAIFGSGQLTISRSTFAGNTALGGGAMGGAGNLAVADSVFSSNTATNGGGGAIDWSAGAAAISGSTFSGNSASHVGGALNLFGAHAISNSTFSGNSTGGLGGGVRLGSGTLTMNNVTVVGNQAARFGGLFGVGNSTITLENSLVAGNTGGADCGVENGQTGGVSLGHNLIGNRTGCAVVFAATDLLGTPASPIDPRLGPLQDNGGPRAGLPSSPIPIPTHALLAGSPAIDAGNPATPGSPDAGACAAADQRGVARGGGVNARCDIGAFERVIVASVDLAVTKTAAPAGVRIGEPLTYTITVTNSGPDGATGVTVTDSLPAGVTTAGPATASQGTCGGAPTVVCDLGVLAAGGNATVTIVVTPATDGSLSNTATVTSAEDETRTASVSVVVAPGNRPPVLASPDNQTNAEGDTVSLAISASDPDADALTFSATDLPPGLAIDPATGVISGVLGFDTAATYVNVVVRAIDGRGGSTSIAFTWTVTDVNRAPAAADQSVTTSEDTPVAITLTASDVDGDTLSFAVEVPTRGTLSGTAPNLTYTPHTNFHGTDSFTFTVRDGPVTSAAATVTITVTPVNDAPMATAQSVTTAEDTPVAITLAGSDVEGEALTFAIASGPSHGTLTGSPPAMTYTPAANFNGTDSFTFTARDAADTSLPATVTITVTPVDDPPVATAQGVTTPEDIPLAITLTGSDADGDALTFTIASGPARGVLSGIPPAVTYTPNANLHGADSFTFTVRAAGVTSAPATVAIMVMPVNDAPVATAQSVTTAEDVPLPITLAGSDLEGDTLTFAIESGPSHGVLSGIPPNVTYTPTANFNGPDSFTFTVRDAAAPSLPAMVSITVTPVADPPVATALTVTTPEDTPVTITLPGSDPDGGALAFAIVTAPRRGTLTGTGATRTYTPAANFSGADSFTFTVNDGASTSAPATVSITVTPVNDPPFFNPIADQTVREDSSPRTVSITGVSPGPGDEVGQSVTLSARSSHPELVPHPAVTRTGAGATLTYQPARNAHGAATITVTADDGQAERNAFSRTFQITVVPVNDRPTANAQSVTTAEESPVDITLTGSDVESDAITFRIVTAPRQGTLTGTGATVTYTPAPNFAGADSFTFAVSDGTLTSTPATVSITVTPVNDAPFFDPIPNQRVAEDAGARTLTITGVSGGPGEPTQAVTLTATSSDPALIPHPTITGTAARRTLSYRSLPNLSGATTITVLANDGQATTNTFSRTFTVTVTPVNDPPAAHAQSVTTAEDTPVAITLRGSDVEGDALAFRVVTAPRRGTLTGSGATLTYTPAANFNGSDSFRFIAVDASLASAPATVSITVTPANDPPFFNAIANQTVNEDAASRTITITGISGGPAGEAGQVVTLTATSSDPALVPHPTITGSTATRRLVFRPAASASGVATITVTADDGQATNNIFRRTFTVTVTPVNDGPAATAQSVTTVEDTPLAITLSGTDVDADALTFAIATGPSHGALTGAAPNLVYTPNANFSGTDSFTFRVTDGALTSPPATVTISVTPGLTLRYSSDITMSLNGATVGGGEVVQDDLAGTVTPVALGTRPAGVNVDGYHLRSDGSHLLSFDVTVALPGGVTAGPADVVRFDGTTYTVAFNAATSEIPAGANVDAVAMVGADLLLSFDTTMALPGGVTAGPADLVRFNGNTFTVFFSGAAAGVPAGLDLDAAHVVESTGRLLLSFDGSGTVGGVTFGKADVLEFDPSTSAWRLVLANSARAAWAGANLDALSAAPSGASNPL